MIRWTLACVRPPRSVQPLRSFRNARPRSSASRPRSRSAAPPSRAPIRPTLRLATIAPQGTGWAREFSAWARDVEAGTHGAVHIKMYYSAIGGDEFTVLDRIKREQLDGGIGSESCTRLAPSCA